MGCVAGRRGKLFQLSDVGSQLLLGLGVRAIEVGTQTRVAAEVLVGEAPSKRPQLVSFLRESGMSVVAQAPNHFELQR